MSASSSSWGKISLDWWRQTRCKQLPDDSARWLNHIYWSLAVEGRASFIPSKFDIAFFATETGLEPDRVLEYNISMAVLELIEWTDELQESIIVVGVAKFHTHLKSWTKNDITSGFNPYRQLKLNPYSQEYHAHPLESPSAVELPIESPSVVERALGQREEMSRDEMIGDDVSREEKTTTTSDSGAESSSSSGTPASESVPCRTPSEDVIFQKYTCAIPECTGTRLTSGYCQYHENLKPDGAWLSSVPHGRLNNDDSEAHSPTQTETDEYDTGRTCMWDVSWPGKYSACGKRANMAERCREHRDLGTLREAVGDDEDSGKIPQGGASENRTGGNLGPLERKAIEDSRDDFKERRDALGDEILDAWNDLASRVDGIPGIRVRRGSIWGKIKTRLKDRDFRDNWEEALTLVEASEWLTGRGREVWFAKLDWVIKPANFEKILNGNYPSETKSEVIDISCKSPEGQPII